jgi:histone deacetylase complex subunit SAP18
MADRRGGFRGRSRSRSRDRGQDGARGRFDQRAPPSSLPARGRGDDQRGRYFGSQQDQRRPQQQQQQQPPQAQKDEQPRFAMQREQAPVDRAKTCPFLMRVFIAKRPEGGHCSEADYSDGRVPPKSVAQEVHLYTWKDATLKELAGLIQEVEPEARHARAAVSFAFVYPNRTGTMVVRTVGTYSSQSPPVAQERTLGGCSFRPGDYLDVNISKVAKPRVAGAGRLRADDISADSEGGGAGGVGGGGSGVGDRGSRGDGSSRNTNTASDGADGGGGGWGGRRVTLRR